MAVDADEDEDAPFVRQKRGQPIRIGKSSAPIQIDPKQAAAIKPSVDVESEDEEGEAEEVTIDEVTPAPPSPKPPDKKVAKPVLEMPTDAISVLSNMLSRELLSPEADEEPEDVSMAVMKEVVRAALEGRDLSELEARIKSVSDMIQDKHELVQAIINGPHALHEKFEWLRVRSSTHQQIRKAARRGDLNTRELLEVANMANDMVQQIDKELKGGSPSDPITVVHRIENSRKREDTATQKLYEGTTPQGREIIRKQAYRIRKAVREHKEKVAAEADD